MGLLQLLFGGGRKPAPDAAPPHTWGMSADGYLQPIPQGNGQMAAPPQIPSQPGALVQAQAQASPATPLTQPPQAAPQAAPQGAPQPGVSNPNPVVVTGQPHDDWHPHKAGVLGQIADYFLGTHFGDENTRRNMEHALSTVNTDPDLAVRRMAEFDPKDAMSLYQHVSGVKHYNQMIDKQNRQLDDLEEQRIFARAGNMMTAANADNWQDMRSQIVRMAAARGESLGQEMDQMLPQEYNPDAAKYISQGAYPVKAQVQAAETARSHRANEALRGEHNADQRDYYQGTVRNGATNAATGQSRQQEQVQHDRTTEKQGQDKIDQKPPVRVKMTKYGPLEITGNVGVLHRPDGTSLRYLTTDGVNFVPTHQKPKGAKK